MYEGTGRWCSNDYVQLQDISRLEFEVFEPSGWSVGFSTLQQRVFIHTVLDGKGHRPLRFQPLGDGALERLRKPRCFCVCWGLPAYP